MASENEYTSALHRLASFLEDMGYSDVNWIDHEDSKMTTLMIDNENPVFKIVCSPDSEYWSIIYDYDLVEAIAEQIDETAAEKHIAVGYEDFQDELGKDELAAHSIIDLLGPDDREEIIFHLQESVFSLPVALEMDNNTIDDNFSSLSVWTNVFPYEEDFSRTTFSRSIGEVVAAGNRARTFLRYAFNLGIEEYKNETADVEKEVATSPRSPP